MVSLTKHRPQISVIQLKFLMLRFSKKLKLMIFITSRQLFVITFWFQEKRRPEMCTVEFVETKLLTVVQAFFFFFVGQCYWRKLILPVELNKKRCLCFCIKNYSHIIIFITFTLDLLRIYISANNFFLLYDFIQCTANLVVKISFIILFNFYKQTPWKF